MKKKSTLVLTLLLAICSIDLLAQSDSLLPYPAKNLIYPNVEVEVTKQPNRYAFSYMVGNGDGALQAIYRFMIEIRANSEISSSPLDWRASTLNYDTIKVAKWSSEDSVSDIEANEILKGFVLKSTGLPAINRCWFRAWETVKGEEGQYDPATASIFVTHLRDITVGPVDPPSPFIHLNFLDTLLSYTRQSVQLGWLKTTRDDDCDEDEQPNDGIAKNIEKRIEKAKRELIKGDSTKARKELEKLVKKVEKIFKKNEELENAALRHPVEREKKRESEIVMTSEAYALLKYNAEYLIERLPEKKSKKNNN